MIRLKKLNVERIADTEARAAALEKEGFVRVGNAAAVEAAEPAGSAADPQAVEAGDAGAGSLESLTVAELRALAKETGLSGYSALTKDELLEVLKEVM